MSISFPFHLFILPSFLVNGIVCFFQSTNIYFNFTRIVFMERKKSIFFRSNWTKGNFCFIFLGENQLSLLIKLYEKKKMNLPFLRIIRIFFIDR